MAQPTSLPIHSTQAAGKPTTDTGAIDAPSGTNTSAGAATTGASSTSMTSSSLPTTVQQQGLPPQSQQPQPQRQHQPPPPHSPNAARKTSLSASEHAPPLTHPSRIHPLHPLLPTPNLLPAPTPAANNGNGNGNGNNNSTASLNPVTLSPFTASELSTHDFEAVLKECKNPKTGEVDKDVARKLQEQAVAQIQERMKERETREKEVEREVAEMEKIREVERKVWRRKMGGKEDGVGGGGGGEKG